MLRPIGNSQDREGSVDAQAVLISHSVCRHVLNAHRHHYDNVLRTRVTLTGVVSYSSFANLGSGPPAVFPSESESRAIGMSVGRLVCPIQTDWSKFSLRDAVLAAGFDVTIVRYATTNSRASCELQCGDLVSWQADTLVYYGIAPKRDPSGVRVVLHPVGASQVDEFSRLVTETFDGYANHYSANPLFADIQTARVYGEWGSGRIGDPLSRVFVARDETMTAVAPVVVDISDGQTCEIVLAGVVPSQRRNGWYPLVLSSISQWAAEEGFTQLVISTQVGNVEAVRGWCRFGMLPLLALNTLHVVTSEVFERRIRSDGTLPSGGVRGR